MIAGRQYKKRPTSIFSLVISQVARHVSSTELLFLRLLDSVTPLCVSNARLPMPYASCDWSTGSC